MVDVAVLLSAGRHPVSGRPRRAPADARALDLALRLPAGRRLALHAGDPETPALRDYLGMGLERLTVLRTAAGHDPLEPLAAHLAAFLYPRRDGVLILAGSRAEGGEDSGMLPYLLAGALDMAIVADAVDVGVDPASGTAEVVQALPRGRRRAVRVALPAVIAVHTAAPPPRPVAFGPARRGIVEALDAAALPDEALAGYAVRPWRPRPRRLAVAPAGGSALDRLRAATEAKAGQGRLLVGVSPEEAARAIYETLEERGMLHR